MAQVQIQRPQEPRDPTFKPIPEPGPDRRDSRRDMDKSTPVNQNGSFEADRVLKCGYVQRRTRKTKVSRSLLSECHSL